jgi:hypothetical protein
MVSASCVAARGASAGDAGRLRVSRAGWRLADRRRPVNARSIPARREGARAIWSRHADPLVPAHRGDEPQFRRGTWPHVRRDSGGSEVGHDAAGRAGLATDVPVADRADGSRHGCSVASSSCQWRRGRRGYHANRRYGVPLGQHRKILEARARGRAKV